jgi:hypothetical protein
VTARFGELVRETGHGDWRVAAVADDDRVRAAAADADGEARCAVIAGAVLIWQLECAGGPSFAMLGGNDLGGGPRCLNPRRGECRLQIERSGRFRCHCRFARDILWISAAWTRGRA